MTTATLVAGNRTDTAVDRPRRSLEELVDQLFAAMGFKDPETETAEAEAAAVLGMRWRPGKVVSGRSLRGLRPLTGGA